MSVDKEDRTGTAFGTTVHANACEEVLKQFQSSVHGITRDEVRERQKKYGRNFLPSSKKLSLVTIVLKQFTSPLIYILVAAALVSIFLEHYSDAGFIGAVLFINALIGAAQEYSAQKSADALQKLVVTQTQVLREGDSYEIDSEELVPGDIVLLESGDRVPADLRLLDSHDLEVDESLLTGESKAVLKNALVLLDLDLTVGDKVNMAFAGTLASRGRGRGVVVGTALNTELGHIAASVVGKKSAKAPLQIRMEKFTQRIAIMVGFAILLMASISFYRGMPLADIFLSSVALAVSAIPEGLPVALTVALAIGMRRMAKRDVIVRELVAVEALGSCTYIATDKTGTLTVNQLTAKEIYFANQAPWDVMGESDRPTGSFLTPSGAMGPPEEALLSQLCRTAILPNEGFLGQRENEWVHHGDAVDVAMLVMANKAGYIKAEMNNSCPELQTIPFESDRLFSASLNQVEGNTHAFVKGAVETLLPMCDRMMTAEGNIDIDIAMIEQQTEFFAVEGFRVLALANAEINLIDGEMFSEKHLNKLTLIGLVAMNDPLRKEAKRAIEMSQQAGITVAMVTGDHPSTAFAIGRELGLVSSYEHVVTGPQLKQAKDMIALDELIGRARVFARIEPQQKLDIVQSLQRNNHFVAVSGDGANDAPALRAAQVGVAMGGAGTDVAKETAKIIITDDNFDSIVAGIEEGRVAYANVRKVIFLLVSTGVAELVLFILSLITGLPLPLEPVQLLWLNLVTNGIQDVALAFEPGEGDELKQNPRSTQEGVFNRLMIERLVISGLVIGIVSFVIFQWLYTSGSSLEEARNSTLLLMVLFENVHVFNCRSETLSAFKHSPLKNPLLLFGTAAAQLIHISAMYIPWLGNVLGVAPVTIGHWSILLCIALTVLLALELHKVYLKNKDNFL